MHTLIARQRAACNRDDFEAAQALVSDLDRVGGAAASQRINVAIAGGAQ
jgi:hypothetical protein